VRSTPVKAPSYTERGVTLYFGVVLRCGPVRGHSARIGNRLPERGFLPGRNNIRASAANSLVERPIPTDQGVNVTDTDERSAAVVCREILKED